MLAQRAFRHDVGQPRLVSAGAESQVDRGLGPAEQLPAGAIQGGRQHDLITVLQLVQRLRQAGRVLDQGVADQPPALARPQVRAGHRQDVPGRIAGHQSPTA
jgi:hypothetical protein